MRQNITQPALRNFRTKGAWAKTKQELTERLWKGEILNKVKIGEEYFSAKENPTFIAQTMLISLRKKIEKYTGKILICRSGEYRLIYQTEDNGEAIHEMGIRRKRAVHAIESFGRPAQYLLTQDVNGEMAQIVEGALGKVNLATNRYTFERLAEQASAKASSENSVIPDTKK